MLIKNWERKRMQHNIGIALSGGGIRAMIFHLGLFKWLAENKMLEQVKRISTVSGASLCVGMVYAHNNLKWPSSEQFLAKVLPSIEKALLVDLQLSAMRKLIISPKYWNKKVNVVAKVLESKWGVQGKLSDLPVSPIWHINCTTFETGKRFRLGRDEMGDYSIGYVKKPDIPISEAMAASAGFPILIGPYVLDSKKYQWGLPIHSLNNQHLLSKRFLRLWDFWEILN
jgi:NTE family protein